MASLRDAAAQQRTGQSGRVLFVIPSNVDSDTAELLVDALTAQFAGENAELDFRTFDEKNDDLRSQVREAQRLAGQDDGIVGVFWLDTESEQSWLLYLAQPEGDRVLVRRVELQRSSQGAAAEAIGLITSRSSTALRAGQTIGMRPVEIESPPETPPDNAPEMPAPRPAPGRAASSGEQGSDSRAEPSAGPSPRRGLRFRGGYRGTHYAERTFQHGFLLGAEWIWPAGAYVGAGAAFFAPVDIDAPFVGFRVRRTPFELVTGWQWGAGQFSVDAEFATTLELVSRNTIRRTTTVQGNVSETRTVLLLGPRARAAYTFDAGFGLYVDLGVDLAVNNFPFVAQLDGERRQLLSPHDHRAVVDAGILLWP